MELSKAPTMEPTLILGMLLHCGPVSNVCQVLNYNSRARGSVLYDAFGEDMVVIFALPKQFPAQLLEMAFCRTGAFGLQLTTETEDTAFLFFPTTLTKKLVSGRDGWPIQAQVNAYRLIRVSNSGFRNGDNDVQKVTSLAVAQIGRTHLAANVSRSLLKYIIYTDYCRTLEERHGWMLTHAALPPPARTQGSPCRIVMKTNQFVEEAIAWNTHF
jgi:hypothetical protein